MLDLPRVRIVSPARFDLGTLQTPGSERRSAIASDLGIKTALWGGTFLVEPGAKTGIHHHGEQETIAYVLEGESVVRWGRRGVARDLDAAALQDQVGEVSVEHLACCAQ